MRLSVVVMAILAASGCAAPATYSRVSIVDLVKNPAVWDGKRVELVGVASSRFEDQSLYSSAEEYCHRPSSKTVAVRWPQTEDFRSAYEGRLVQVSGLFRNENGTERPIADGKVLVTLSLASAGPGPLTKVKIMKLLPGPATACD